MPYGSRAQPWFFFYSPSATEIIVMDQTIYTSAAAAYAKIAQFTLKSPIVPGSYFTFTWQIRRTGGAGGNAKIYKNGVAIGTATAFADAVYNTTFTDTIRAATLGDLNVGDTLELWAYAIGGSGLETKNFSINGIGSGFKIG